MVLPSLMPRCARTPKTLLPFGPALLTKSSSIGYCTSLPNSASWELIFAAIVSEFSCGIGSLGFTSGAVQTTASTVEEVDCGISTKLNCGFARSGTGRQNAYSNFWG
jgi:hypothetical protein